MPSRMAWRPRTNDWASQKAHFLSLKVEFITGRLSSVERKSGGYRQVREAAIRSDRTQYTDVSCLLTLEDRNSSSSEGNTLHRKRWKIHIESKDVREIRKGHNATTLDEIIRRPSSHSYEALLRSLRLSQFRAYMCNSIHSRNHSQKAPFPERLVSMLCCSRIFKVCATVREKTRASKGSHAKAISVYPFSLRLPRRRPVETCRLTDTAWLKRV